MEAEGEDVGGLWLLVLARGRWEEEQVEIRVRGIADGD